MHDPQVMAFNIKIFGHEVVTIWHVDPEKDGTDDSCGWFMRSRHGDAKVLEKIIKDFDWQWDHGVNQGWFSGRKPNYSNHAIVLMMFRTTVNNVFGHWSKRADRFLINNLHKILSFAENSCDSFHTFIQSTYYNKLSEEDKKRDDRIENKEYRVQEAAEIIYAWVLREDRAWWKHPKWHFWHWKLQVHPWNSFRRRWISKCRICGKGFAKGESVVGQHWDSLPDRWFECFRGERDIAHMHCAGENIYVANDKGDVSCDS